MIVINIDGSFVSRDEPVGIGVSIAEAGAEIAYLSLQLPGDDFETSGDVECEAVAIALREAVRLEATEVLIVTDSTEAANLVRPCAPAGLLVEVQQVGRHRNGRAHQLSVWGRKGLDPRNPQPANVTQPKAPKSRKAQISEGVRCWRCFSRLKLHPQNGRGLCFSCQEWFAHVREALEEQDRLREAIAATQVAG